MNAGSGRVVKELLETVIIALILAFFVRSFVVESFVVDGRSMEPTLINHERLFVNKFIYRFQSPSRGDVVVFRYPRDPSRDFIKRIIGLPGETIEIRSGVVFIQGIALEESYITNLPPGSMTERIVPEGHVFVLGDNRSNSEDSRFFGYLPQVNIKGKAFMVYWPTENLRMIRN